MGVAAAPPRQMLVATDLSPRAGLAVTRAAQLSREHGARLSVLQVLPTEITDDIADHARRHLQTHLTEHADSTAIDIALRRGEPACEITAEAADRRADLIVVGAHGEQWLLDAFLGSTAENLVRMSPAPVLLVKKPAMAPYRTVILAVDTSSSSADAAHFGCSLAPTADLILVHACTVVGENLMRVYGATDEQIEELRRTSTEQAREHIARLTDTLAPRPKQVIITTGHPPVRLVELSHSYAADVVVVGTGARSPMSYAFLGSVAQHVMRQAQSDVLVVPAETV